MSRQSVRPHFTCGAWSPDYAVGKRTGRVYVAVIHLLLPPSAVMIVAKIAECVK